MFGLDLKSKPVQNLIHGVGLDISNNYLKIIQLSRRWSGVTLCQWGKEAIPARVINRGMVEDPVRLGALLYRLFQSKGLSNPKVVVAVPPQQVFTRHLSLPPMPVREIRTAIGYQVQSGLLPIPPQEAVLDFMVDSSDRRCLPGKSIEILLVAVRRLVIDRLQISLRQAGAVMQALELEPLALHRTFLAGRPPAAPGRICSIVAAPDFSRFKTRLPFLAKPQLKPVICPGWSQPTQAEPGLLLLNVEPGLAKFSLFGRGFLRFNRTVSLNQKNNSVDPVALIMEIAAETRRTLDYYQLKYPHCRVEKVLFTGGGISLAESAAAVLADQISVPIERLNPLEGIQTDQTVAAEELADMQSSYGVALGLARRGLSQFGSL